MDIYEIKEYLNEQYPDLRLGAEYTRPHGTIEITGRIQYGFYVHDHLVETGTIDANLKWHLQKLIDLAQTQLDRMKIRDGEKQEILGVQAVLVEGGEYWVSPDDYVKLLNEGGEGPQSEASMQFDGKPIRYHEGME
jgi:hypothetical protein